jgi:nucleoside-diphosphate-sugar epimerase
VVYATAQPAYTEWPERFPPLMQAILTGVAHSGAKLVFGDNVYMYGPNGGQPLHEGLPYTATTRKGSTRARIAQSLLDAHAAGTARVTIGRAADFYGPRCTDSTVGTIVFGAILAGKPANLLGNLDLPHTYYYIRDFAKGLVILGSHDQADGQAWHIPSPPTLTTRQFVTQVAEQAGKPLKLQVAGPFLVSVLALFNPMLRELKEMLYQNTEPYIVDHSRFVAAFGDISTPHAQAIDETLAWFRAHHR